MENITRAVLKCVAMKFKLQNRKLLLCAILFTTRDIVWVRDFGIGSMVTYFGGIKLYVCYAKN